eukprot:TRINITY_DN19226_c0_g1_i2.p1 TRINITY_DN19226_c0_g1~~TRINITY_DN19226_c0_g1_i2.p1  ORF type:complete len:791 (-),score=109.82 TRINITY_DN19226_c0_g1_i2:35-2383(-)
MADNYDVPQRLDPRGGEPPSKRRRAEGFQGSAGAAVLFEDLDTAIRARIDGLVSRGVVTYPALRTQVYSALAAQPVPEALSCLDRLDADLLRSPTPIVNPAGYLLGILTDRIFRSSAMPKPLRKVVDRSVAEGILRYADLTSSVCDHLSRLSLDDAAAALRRFGERCGGNVRDRAAYLRGILVRDFGFRERDQDVFKKSGSRGTSEPREKARGQWEEDRERRVASSPPRQPALSEQDLQRLDDGLRDIGFEFANGVVEELHSLVLKGIFTVDDLLQRNSGQVVSALYALPVEEAIGQLQLFEQQMNDSVQNPIGYLCGMLTSRLFRDYRLDKQVRGVLDRLVAKGALHYGHYFQVPQNCCRRLGALPPTSALKALKAFEENPTEDPVSELGACIAQQEANFVSAQPKIRADDPSQPPNLGPSSYAPLPYFAPGEANQIFSEATDRPVESGVLQALDDLLLRGVLTGEGLRTNRFQAVAALAALSPPEAVELLTKFSQLHASNKHQINNPVGYLAVMLMNRVFGKLDKTVRSMMERMVVAGDANWFTFCQPDTADLISKKPPHDVLDALERLRESSRKAKIRDPSAFLRGIFRHKTSSPARASRPAAHPVQIQRTAAPTREEAPWLPDRSDAKKDNERFAPYLRDRLAALGCAYESLHDQARGALAALPPEEISACADLLEQRMRASAAPIRNPAGLLCCIATDRIFTPYRLDKSVCSAIDRAVIHRTIAYKDFTPEVCQLLAQCEPRYAVEVLHRYQKAASEYQIPHPSDYLRSRLLNVWPE